MTYRDELLAVVEKWHDNAEANYREKGDHYWEGVMDGYSATLTLIEDDKDAEVRAKVEALRDEAMNHHWADAIIAYQTVLALIDDGGDDD